MVSEKDPDPPVSAFCFSSCAFNRSPSFCLRELPPSYTLSPAHPPIEPPIAFPITKPSPGIGMSVCPITPPSNPPASAPPAPAAAFPTLSPSARPVAKSSPANNALPTPTALIPPNFNLGPLIVGFGGFAFDGLCGFPNFPLPGNILPTNPARSNAPLNKDPNRFPGLPKLFTIFKLASALIFFLSGSFDFSNELFCTSKNLLKPPKLL